MKVHIKGKGEVQLSQKDFVAKGGEGKIFIKNNIVFKIFEDAKKMIPEAKIQELQAITNLNVLKPKEILLGKGNKIIGFTMDHASNTVPICKIFTNTFRTTNGLTNDTSIGIVQTMRETFTHIHEKGCLIVDANELNFLVDDKTFKVVYFIDVNSYQTKSFPATAIMPSIRDWTNNSFNEDTDWYSFAVIACQLFVGTHPYKGKHSKYGKVSLEQRVKDHVSIFNPDGIPPKNMRDISNIPTGYMDWFLDLFEKGKRLPPPSDTGTAVATKTKFIIITSNDNFEIQDYKDFGDDIVLHQGGLRGDTTRTKGYIFLGSVKEPVSPGVGIVYTTRSTSPILIRIQNDQLELLRLVGDLIQPSVTCSRFMVIGNTIYLKDKGQLHELVFNELGTQIIASIKTTWNIMPNSSELYDGMIVQSVLGNSHVVIPLPESSSLIDKHIPELDEYRIIAAKHDSGVCFFIGYKDNQYHRIIIKFGDRYVKYHVRVTNDIDNNSLNFVTLENGVVVTIIDDENMEVFLRNIDKTTVKTIKDQNLSTNMKLCKSGTQLRFFTGSVLYNIKMK